MPIKTTMKCHLTSVRMATINKSTSRGKHVEKREPQCTRGGNADLYRHCGKQYEVTSRSSKWNCVSTQKSHFWEHILRIPRHQFSTHLYVIAALFIIAKSGNSQSTHQQMSGYKSCGTVRNSYTVEYYMAVKMKELTLCVTARIDLEIIMPSEISQSEKDKYHMISSICGI